MDTWSGWCRGVLDINDPCHIVTSSSGQNIAVGCDLTIKVFDHRGKFEKFFRIPALLADKENIRNRLKNRSCLEYFNFSESEKETHSFISLSCYIFVDVMKSNAYY